MDTNSYLLNISEDRKTIDIVQTYKHPKKVFGVRWNPFDKNQFATCCEDGILRIFNSENVNPVRVGKGHT
jgi:WD40 repeat protein